MFVKADFCQGQITHSSSLVLASLKHIQLQSRAKSTLVFFSRIVLQELRLLLFPTCWDCSHSLAFSSWDSAVPSQQGWGNFPLDLNQLLWLCRWGEKSKSDADTYSQLLWALHSFFTSGLLSANTTWDHQRVPDRTEWIKRSLKLPQLSWNLLTRSYFVFNHLHQFFSVISTFPKIKVDCQ